MNPSEEIQRPWEIPQRNKTVFTFPVSASSTLFCLQCSLLAQILPILQGLNPGGTLFKRTIILWSGNFSTNLPMVMRCCGPRSLKIMVFLSRYSSPLCEELQMFSLGCCQYTLGWRELRGYGWGANSTGYTSILPRIKSHNQPFLLSSLPATVL